MAKKKSRKSRRQRTRRSERRQPVAPQESTPARAEPAVQAAPPPKPKKKAKPEKETRLIDFVHEYAYVYYDLRKMFTLAFIMLVLLVVVNFVLTHYVVVGG